MKKYLYTLLAAPMLFLAPTITYSEGPAQSEDLDHQVGVYASGLGVLAIATLLAASVNKYGTKFTVAAAASAAAVVATWKVMNQAASSGMISAIADACSVNLIPENTILTITPAAIIGATFFGSLVYYITYAFLHTPDNTGHGTRTTITHRVTQV